MRNSIPLFSFSKLLKLIFVTAVLATNKTAGETLPKSEFKYRDDGFCLGDINNTGSDNSFHNVMGMLIEEVTPSMGDVTYTLPVKVISKLDDTNALRNFVMGIRSILHEQGLRAIAEYSFSKPAIEGGIDVVGDQTTLFNIQVGDEIVKGNKEMKIFFKFRDIFLQAAVCDHSKLHSAIMDKINAEVKKQADPSKGLKNPAIIISAINNLKSIMKLRHTELYMQYTGGLCMGSGL